MFPEIVILLVSLVALGFFAHFLVHASIRLAKLFKVSEAFIGLTIVSMGTGAPEIAVSVSAALNGQGALSVGNVIGSNIFNLGFILGIVAIIAPQKIMKKMVYRDGLVLLLSTVLVLLFMWNQFLSRTEGAVLLFCLVAYNLYLWMKKDIPDEEEVEEEEKGKWWKDVPVFFVSLLGLIYSAEHVVASAVDIARNFGISEWAIGATIVAAGTSLPEVATSIIATLRGKFGLSVGNVIGSDIFNVFGIIGVSAVIAPLALNSEKSVWGMPDNLFSVSILILTILLTLYFMRTKWRIGRVEGGILLFIAALRMIFELLG
jgi:cation:H+ antiporter